MELGDHCIAQNMICTFSNVTILLKNRSRDWRLRLDNSDWLKFKAQAQVSLESLFARLHECMI